MLHFRSGQALRNVPAHHGVDMKRVAARRAAAKNAGMAVQERASYADPGSSPDIDAWDIPVLKTIAETGYGVSELAETLDRHRTWLTDSGEMSTRRRQRLAERVREEVARSVQRSVWQKRGGAEALERALPDLEAGRVTPYDVAALILRGNA
jgi:LAO/AO transport system kinase